MTEFNLTETFELSGFWWLPGQDEKRVPGVLKHTPEKGITLEIWKLTDNTDLELLTESEIIDTIHGVALLKSESGKKDFKITLSGAFITNNSVGFGTPLTKKVFFANYAFIGEWFDSFEQIQFNKLSFEIENLEDWIRYLPYEGNMTFGEKGGFQEYSIKFKKDGIPVKSFNIPSLQCECILSVVTKSLPVARTAKNLTFEFSPLLSIKPAEGNRSFENLQTYAFNIIYLLILLVGKPLRIKSITGYTDQDSVKILSRPRYMSKRNFKEHEVMVPFPDIEDRFEEILKIWFDELDKIDSVIHLLMEVFYESDSDVTHRRTFLDMVQAFETYHREDTGIEKVKKDNGKGQRDIYLSERFQSQFQELDAEIKKYLFKSDVDFIRIIVDSRNYYTHFSKDKKDRALKGVKLFWGALKIRLILHLLLLEKLSLSKSYIMEALSRDRYYCALPNQHIE